MAFLHILAWFPVEAGSFRSRLYVNQISLMTSINMAGLAQIDTAHQSAVQLRSAGSKCPRLRPKEAGGLFGNRSWISTIKTAELSGWLVSLLGPGWCRASERGASSSWTKGNRPHLEGVIYIGKTCSGTRKSLKVTKLKAFPCSSCR